MFFSGAGGLGAGVESAGWTVVAAVDHDSRALETHRANFRGLALDVDMSDGDAVKDLIALIAPAGIDLVVGGPPCQPFSRAGRAKIRSLVDDGVREEVDARKELWRSFIEVVRAIRPRAVIMENVPDMAIGDDLVVVRELADILESQGYAVDYRLLDAWRYGVPQHRKRFILQARNDGSAPLWPAASSERPTVRHAIEDLPQLGDTTGERELVYKGSPEHSLARHLRGAASSKVIHDHMTRAVREDDREAFGLMTSTTLYSDLPKHLQRYRTDSFNDKYKRLDWDDLSRTITAHIAKDGYWYIHPSEARTLTVREAARIQTFPDSFRFAGTRSDAFRQIGNAVPPLLGRDCSDCGSAGSGWCARYHGTASSSAGRLGDASARRPLVAVPGTRHDPCGGNHRGGTGPAPTSAGRSRKHHGVGTRGNSAARCAGGADAVPQCVASAGAGGT
ncbi:DNA cytosine methyltransferase [Nocardioides sp. W3-2-3]|uniref:DNA cytosine methyltransferase n=1 Tax=Nocardioides convexus TaxID=2712224 RepID=UPI0024185A9F|nr:DNA cytosine methyltransferase [Nocardioides convexus]NHA00601.1 DNA cytosine methyltransferase [Nocardioides convexus]